MSTPSNTRPEPLEFDIDGLSNEEQTKFLDPVNYRNAVWFYRGELRQIHAGVHPLDVLTQYARHSLRKKGILLLRVTTRRGGAGLLTVVSAPALEILKSFPLLEAIDVLEEGPGPPGEDSEF